MNENIIDKRVYKTLTKIENDMIRLLEDKPYKDINVKDICRESGISRGTFISIIQIKMIFISISKRNDEKIEKMVEKNEHIERIQFLNMY